MKDDTLAVLGATVRTLRAGFDRELRTEGLRLGQFQVLSILWNEDGLTPRELSNRLQVEMPTVTRTVQRMVRDGLVQREAHPNDARSVYIRITEKGRAVRAPIERLLERHSAKILQGFSDAERAQFVALLQRMHSNAK